MRKYLGPLECILLPLVPLPCDSIAVTNPDPWLAYKMMAAHASQFVWYRRLFVIFSRYSYINTLKVWRSSS